MKHRRTIEKELKKVEQVIARLLRHHEWRTLELETRTELYNIRDVLSWVLGSYSLPPTKLTMSAEGDEANAIAGLLDRRTET